MSNLIHYYIPTEDSVDNEKLESGFPLHAFEEEMGLYAVDILGQEFVRRMDGQFYRLTVKFNLDYDENDIEELYLSTAAEIKEWEENKDYKDQGIHLTMFPNYLGINLCSVAGQRIKRIKSTKQLIEVECIFTPITKKDSAYDKNMMCPDTNSDQDADFLYGKPNPEFLKLIQPYLVN